ncbi:hypothetical protein SAMN05877809_11524 [Rhodobacter sp. JA431]|uniref:hypothetical protein n=1 Tax=Rhodobacter sp. JA431 TaxID=570013 RepID=UPI000BDD6693|nr:hypothetical protein [Rhodobacter sp. JA431]SOC21241.1 hypothetical protein SAMN05877809_11524 [Rhodobacter sp. JA431]
MDLLMKGGSIIGTGVAGLLAILEFTRGKRPDKIETKPDGTTVVVHNNIEVRIDSRMLDLLQDVATREAVEKFAQKSLSIPDVARVVISDGDADGVELGKVDQAALMMPALEDDETLTETSQREVWLRIVVSAFRDGYKWRLSDGGEKPFTATMEDTDFVNSVMDGKVSLSANDTSKCLIREDQKLGPSGLSKDVTVLRVIEHIPGAKQMKLI